MSAALRTAVIGGGMAGCTAARDLADAGRDVVLFEAADGVGGRARSWHRPEIDPDVGINLMYVSFYPLMTEAVRRYGLEGELETISSDVWIVGDGKPVPLSSDSPLHLLGYAHVPMLDRVRFLVHSLREVMRRKDLDLFDPYRSAPIDDGTTAAQYGYRHLSRRAFDFLLRPQIEGFWNFASEAISSAHARALLAWLGGSDFHVFREGMETLAERLVADAEVRLGHEVSAIRPTGGGVAVTAGPSGAEPVVETFDEVVVATPAHVAAALCADLPSTVVSGRMRRYLETQEYEPALSVAFLVEPDQLPAGAHIVAGGPDDPPLRNAITYPRRVLNDDGSWSDRLLVFTYPGRALTRRLLGLPPEQQFAAVAPLLRTLWPELRADPEPFHVVERPHGFPIPAPGRYRASVEALDTLHPPVVFAGDYFNSPTTEAAMLSGRRAAGTLLRSDPPAAQAVAPTRVHEEIR